MNVCQSIPRRDCKVFAKCGAKSLSHCRRHREIDEKCKSCTLIRRKPRNRIIDDSGREMKKCTHCGNYFYLNRFYNRIVVRKGKEYHLLTSGAVCVCHRLIIRGQRRKSDLSIKFFV